MTEDKDYALIYISVIGKQPRQRKVEVGFLDTIEKVKLLKHEWQAELEKLQNSHRPEPIKIL